MRVLFTASGLKVGGATMAMLHLLLGLPSQGVKPILLSTKPLPRFRFIYERLREKGVEIIFFGDPIGGVWFWLKLFLESIRVIKEKNVGLVHCHGTKEALVVGLAAKLLGRKMVYTVEGDPLLEMRYSGGYGLLSRLALTFAWFAGLRLADVVVGCSRWMARHLERYGVEAQEASNPIDIERFSSAHGEGLGGLRVVSVARFAEVKGLETLLHAAKEVVSRIPDVKFLLVGGGPLEDKLKDLAKRLSIQKNIEFMGFRSDTEKIVAGSDILILPSLYEPFGMAAAEALAAGKPVIVARTGGLQEIVRDGVDGFLFTPGNYRELAEKLLRVLRDEGLRRRMGEEARRGASRFAPEIVAKTYVRIYREVLS